MTENPAEPDFWNQRYVAAQTPWDFGGVPAALQRYLAANPGPGQSVLIPGCGPGHEIAAFATAGYAVTAVDFSPPAVAQARRRLGPTLGGAVHFADFFAGEFPHGPFDLVYERTFLCALPVVRRPEIVARTRTLLKSGGRLVGLYYYGEKEEGPPFGLEHAEAAALFDGGFELTLDLPVPPHESPALFAGKERWQERRHRA